VRIVVVEDNKLYRDELLQCLEQEESDIEIIGSAANGARGLALVEKLVREKAGPDVIFTDIRMPEMDGKEASRKIRSMADKRADAAEIPILAMTAQASTESIHQCELAGMNECIFKPVNAKELIGLLQDIVEKI